MDLDAIEWPPQHPDFASLPTPDVAHHVLVVVVGNDENERSMEKLYVESVAAVYLRGFRTLVAGVAGRHRRLRQHDVPRSHLCRAVRIRRGFVLRRRLAFLRVAHVSVCGPAMFLIQAKHVFTAKSELESSSFFLGELIDVAVVIVARKSAIVA
jgi:hypothetical protein